MKRSHANGRIWTEMPPSFPLMLATFAVATFVVAAPADARANAGIDASSTTTATNAPENDARYAFEFTPDPIAATGPKIFRVQLNSNELHARGPIAIRVVTSHDVETVTSGSGNRSGTLVKRAPGVFEGSSTLPSIGVSFFKMHMNLHVTATTAAGDSTSTDVPVSYH